MLSLVSFMDVLFFSDEISLKKYCFHFCGYSIVIYNFMHA